MVTIKKRRTFAPARYAALTWLRLTRRVVHGLFSPRDEAVLMMFAVHYAARFVTNHGFVAEAS